MTDKQKQGRAKVAAWKSSGLSQREYCERSGVSRSTLAYWSSRVNAEKISSGFVEIEDPSASTGGGDAVPIEVLVGDRYRVRLAGGFSAEALKRVLQVLESR